MTATVFPAWFMLGTAAVLLGLFSVSYIYDMLSKEYSVAAPVYGIVAVIIGSIFGTEAIKGLKNGR